MKELIRVEKLFPIELESYYGSPKYQQLRVYKPKQRKIEIEKEEFENLAKGFIKRNKEAKFILEKKKDFLIFTTQNKTKLHVPIFYNIKDKGLYIPKDIYDKKPKLVNFVVFTWLNSMGKLEKVKTIVERE
jgi:hypothetical protein